MRIFISHSSQDKDIVDSFTALLTSTFITNPDDIFCTSLDGHKIASGDEWRDSIKKNLEDAEIVFLLLTENYKKSEICLSEMGAVYFFSKARQIPLIISENNHFDVGVLYETKQYENLFDSGSLERLKDILIESKKIKSDFWERNKRKFIKEIKTISEMNKEANKDSVDLEDGFNRGFYSEFIVDSIFSHHDRTSNIELIRQLSVELRNLNERTIDLKYNYLGSTSAANWINLSQHPSYGHVKLINFFRDYSEEIISKLGLKNDEKIDYISLGSGDGEIDKHIILNLLSTNNLNTFYPFDISFELLQKVVNEISTCNWWKPKKIKIKAIHGDFLELVSYKKIFDFDSIPNFFSLLGFTFGNYNEAEFIGKIKEGMSKGDFLLLDARLHDLKIEDKLTNEDRNKIIANYNNESTNKFVFGALEAVTTADYKSVSFECVPNKEVTSVPDAINIMIYCKGINARFKSDNKQIKKESVCLGLTTLYTFESLKSWLSTRGFQIVWSKAISGNGFILLKKN